MVRSLRALRGLALLAAAALTLSGCDAITGSDDATYVLATINDAPLPAPWYASEALVVTHARLTLRSDGTVTQSTEVRCRTDLPPTTTCSAGDQPFVSTGTYSRSEGWLLFGDTTDFRTRRIPAEFSSRKVVVTMGGPSSWGYFPLYRLEYRR